jgi:hypothetical protein
MEQFVKYEQKMTKEESANITVREPNVVTLDKNAINKVAEKMSQNMDIPVEEAKAILGIGIVEGIMLNRFRGTFDRTN